jgi:hypothetical protein
MMKASEKNENKAPMCNKCKHNIKLSSCGACADKGIDQVKNIMGVDSSEPISEADEIQYLKYACKIVVNNPSDFSEVDPFACKFYFPNFLKLF